MKVSTKVRFGVKRVHFNVQVCIFIRYYRIWIQKFKKIVTSQLYFTQVFLKLFLVEAQRQVNSETLEFLQYPNLFLSYKERNKF